MGEEIPETIEILSRPETRRRSFTMMMFLSRRNPRTSPAGSSSPMNRVAAIATRRFNRTMRKALLVAMLGIQVNAMFVDQQQAAKAAKQRLQRQNEPTETNLVHCSRKGVNLWYTWRLLNKPRTYDAASRSMFSNNKRTTLVTLMM